MTRTEFLQRLQTIKDKGTQALRLLESKPLSVDSQAEIRSLTQRIKEELHNEAMQPGPPPETRQTRD
jgi:hypothetical protein